MSISFKAVAAVMILCGSGPAFAAVTYDLSGSFKPSDGASFRSLLGGGSFDGTFVLSNATFPAAGTTNFVSYTINLRNSAGTVIAVLSQAPGGANGGYISASSSTQAFYGGTGINFYEAVNGLFVKNLFLVVPVGFAGTGGIVPGSSSTAGVRQGTVQQEATVLNASIMPRAVTAPAVPEPASWAIMLTGLGLAGANLRSRRVRLALVAG